MYTIDHNADEPIMLINSHVGWDETDGQGIDGATFQSELLYLDSLGKKRIQVWINSLGGVVMDGYSIYNAILKSKTPVDTYCVGCAASIAGVIFQAGRKRIMADYSWLMYHNPFTSSGEPSDVLDTMKESLIKMIGSRSGMSEDEVGKMMSRETFILAEEAKQMGLCDEIDQTEKLNNKYLKKVSNSANFYQECKKVVNSLLINNHQTMSPKVTMRLKLNDAATEDNIIKAIDEIENRAKTAEVELQKEIGKAQDKAKADSEEIDALKAKVAKAKEEYEKAKKDLEDCKNELDAMKEDKKNAEEAAQAEKAKNMVEGFAKAGRIKNEAAVILKWTNLAKADFDGTKAMIEDLPLNKVAPVLNPEENKLKEGELPTNAMSLAVQNRLKRQGKL